MIYLLQRTRQRKISAHLDSKCMKEMLTILCHWIPFTYIRRITAATETGDTLLCVYFIWIALLYLHHKAAVFTK